MTYARKTGVPVDRSRFQIEHVLSRAGAEQFGYMVSRDGAAIGFRYQERNIRIAVPLPDPDSKAFSHNKSGHELQESMSRKRYEQEVRRRWRALLLVIKSKLEAVESGISEFEVEFLPYIVLPGGKTVAQMVLPKVKKAYETGQEVPLLGGKV